MSSFLDNFSWQQLTLANILTRYSCLPRGDRAVAHIINFISTGAILLTVCWLSDMLHHRVHGSDWKLIAPVNNPWVHDVLYYTVCRRGSPYHLYTVSVHWIQISMQGLLSRISEFSFQLATLAAHARSLALSTRAYSIESTPRAEKFCSKFEALSDFHCKRVQRQKFY